MNIEGAEELVAGLMYGLINKDDLPEIQKCLKNAEALEVEFTGAIADLEKGDLEDIIKAAQEIGQIIKELPADLQDCQDMQGDITKITVWAKQFANPATLVQTLFENISANIGPVHADIDALTADSAAAKYYNVGEDIADITILALGQISKAKEQEPFADSIKNLNLFWA